MRICFSGQMRWVLARAWNDNNVWSRDCDFTGGGRKSWFRHQDVHPQGQSGKDKDGVGRLALSLENNLLSAYKNETIGTDPLVLFYFHHAIFVFMFVIMQYVRESFTLLPSYFYAIHPYAKRKEKIRQNNSFTCASLSTDIIFFIIAAWTPSPQFF